MTREEIISLAENYIMQAQAGLEIENPKMDFKACWYNLTTNYGINEFVKDTSAIANTFGHDGFIIIGYDAKIKCLSNAKFSSSGLNDSSQIQGLINKKVDRLYDVNIYEAQVTGIDISIIHIPPSVDKPHAIRLYQTFDKDGKLKKEEDQKVFVKNGSVVRPASKNDFELMFYDRKNIIPEYQILSSLNRNDFLINLKGQDTLKANVNITFENSGRRPICIAEIKFNFQDFEDASKNQIYQFKTESLLNYIIPSGSIQSFSIQFIHPIPSYAIKVYNDYLGGMRNRVKKFINKNLMIKLSNGKDIQSELTIW